MLTREVVRRKKWDEVYNVRRCCSDISEVRMCLM